MRQMPGVSGPIADPGLTSAVRQACNFRSVVRVPASVRVATRHHYREERLSSGEHQNGIRQGLTGRKGNAVRELYLLDGDVAELGWQERALCAQTDPEAFFPEKGGSTREAKRVCLTCDVRDECLEYALGHDERFGIWGGLSERERRKLKKRAV
jgi:WhiB family transcriptional regulator, redox-sensing transcriptional regulator